MLLEGGGRSAAFLDAGIRRVEAGAKVGMLDAGGGSGELEEAGDRQVEVGMGNRMSHAEVGMWTRELG
eukprot:771864-Pyramimonas_sp.AAC.1